MNSTVLATKWRPRLFSELIGQEPIVTALSNSLDSDRIHHSYLLTGSRGVGKTTLARILAKCLNCDEVCIRNFRQFITGAGCFCKIHTNENKREKTIATCLKNHGVEHPSQSEEIKYKKKQLV